MVVQSARERGLTLEWRDSQIAGLVRAHDARLATRKVRRFRELGVELIEPG